MKYRQLRALPEKEEYFRDIEGKIRHHWMVTIYFPLMRTLKQPKRALSNARQDVIDALQSGQIQFNRGEFTGRFNSSLSRELKRLGATWDSTQGSWRVPRSSLPVDIKSAIDSSITKFEQMAEKVNKQLSEFSSAEIAQRVKLSDLFDATLYKIDEDFKENVKSISIVPKLTSEQASRISREYTKNVELYIEEWTREEITKLRQAVKERTFAGVRYESLVKLIQESYGSSVAKAKFLARQETMLMATKFKQTRYEEIGIREYRWKTVAGSKLHPVRPLHKVHDGKIFTWDNPPITDKNGNRKNPGQDYGCRCTAIPIVKF